MMQCEPEWLFASLTGIRLTVSTNTKFRSDNVPLAMKE